MSGVPGVKDVSLCLEGAASDQRVVDRAAKNSHIISLSDRQVVLVTRQRDRSEMLTNVVQKQQNLLSTQPLSTGKSGHRCVNLGEAMSRTRIGLAAGSH